jgi:soluble lytic murein transglycosylase-like protein
MTRASSFRTFAFCLLPFALALIFARPASADLVHLTNGRVVSVDSWELRGDTAVLKLRDGGEMEAPASQVAEVLPDEYVRIKPRAEGAPAAAVAPLPADDLHAMVSALATRYHVDVKLANAVVTVESDFKPHAVSPKGAKGLMQLMPSVAELYSVSDPFNPVENVEAGLRHLRGLLDRFHDDVATALAAYNAGVFAVAKYGGIPPYPETQSYVRRILALAK